MLSICQNGVNIPCEYIAGVKGGGQGERACMSVRHLSFSLDT